MPEQIDPQAAHARLQSEPGAVYLDVRSVMEFDQGHPTGAWNIPLLHATPSGMQPNPSFLQAASAALSKDALVVVGCKSGQRSAMACRALAQAGFTNVINLAGGFHGHSDPFGRMLSPGWTQCNLPSTTEPTPGKSWEELELQVS
jgi:rhodanese-related sulfurtransferase